MRPDLVCLCQTVAKALPSSLGKLEDVALGKYCPLHGERKCARAIDGDPENCDFMGVCEMVCGWRVHGHLRLRLVSD